MLSKYLTTSSTVNTSANLASISNIFHSKPPGTRCFDPVYCNELPDRVAPLDQLRQFEKSGYIGKVYDFFYSTTGTGTAVGNSEKFGREMGQELKVAGVDAVILTST